MENLRRLFGRADTCLGVEKEARVRACLEAPTVSVGRLSLGVRAGFIFGWSLFVNERRDIHLTSHIDQSNSASREGWSEIGPSQNTLTSNS